MRRSIQLAVTVATAAVVVGCVAIGASSLSRYASETRSPTPVSDEQRRANCQAFTLDKTPADARWSTDAKQAYLEQIARQCATAVADDSDVFTRR